MSQLIPRIVHYCWFGGAPKPISVLRYIASWERVLPGYEIREWNEQNFDVDAWAYASQAYRARRYAFVSDVARLHALYTYGGIYLDTDVEVRRPFDDLLKGGVVLGFEEGNYIATSTMLAEPRAALLGAFLDDYRSRSFLRPDGTLDQTTNVQVLTSMLEGAGLRLDGSPQYLNWNGQQINVLDRVKLSPFDYINGVIHADETTYAIHQFGQSWSGGMTKAKTAVRKALIGVVGGKNVKRLRQLFRFGARLRNDEGA